MPGRGRSSPSTSSSMTDVCGGSPCISGLSRRGHVLRQLGAGAFGFGSLALPLGLRPDLDTVGETDHDDVAFELGVLAQELRDDDASELVGLSGDGAREEVALEASSVALELIERADALGLAAPAFGVPDDEAAVESAGDDETVLEGGAE